jgi:hypothetical protein
VSASIISRFGLRFVGSSVASSAAAGDVLVAVLLAFALSFLIAAPGHIAGTATAAAFVAVAHAAAA